MALTGGARQGIRKGCGRRRTPCLCRGERFKTKLPRIPGEYKIDGSVEGINGLREFSAVEYVAMGRQFESEKNYNAPPIEFLEKQWSMILGNVNDRLYKIAPYLELPSKQEGSPIAMGTLRYCTEMLGEPTSQKALFTWDTTDGNVILQTAETDQGVAINLFITSRAVQNLKRLK